MAVLLYMTYREQVCVSCQTNVAQ